MIDLKKYFSDINFTNMLTALKNKYITYGKCVGNINIKPETQAEADKLSIFLCLYIKPNVVNRVKISHIQKCLDESVFDGITVEDLIKLFYPNVVTNKEFKDKTENIVFNKLSEYRNIYKDSHIIKILYSDEILKKIKYLILNDNLLLNNILKSLDNLPCINNEIVDLAIFSSIVTGNPHYYDLDTHNSNVFIKFICYLLDINYFNTRKEKIKILECAGIIIDNVSNYVITYNLGGNEMLDSFKNNLTPLTLNLANIKKIDEVIAKNNKLLIVENPSFISKVIDKNINYSVIVTSGNSNLVVYKLLEKIKNVEIYFNGDFDPEGLLIAQNFKIRFPNIKFVGYNKVYYKNGISSKVIADARLKKLSNINDSDLNTIKKMLMDNKKASYQEANYDMLICEGILK